MEHGTGSHDWQIIRLDDCCRKNHETHAIGAGLGAVPWIDLTDDYAPACVVQDGPLAGLFDGELVVGHETRASAGQAGPSTCDGLDHGRAAAYSLMSLAIVLSVALTLMPDD
jgi:hypothetical protein